MCFTIYIYIYVEYVEVTEDKTKKIENKVKKTGQTNTQGQDDNGRFKVQPYAIWRNVLETAR